jgi:hypothetical protein
MKWKSERLNRISTKKHEINLVTFISEEAVLEMQFASAELQQSVTRLRHSHAREFQHVQLKVVDSEQPEGAVFIKKEIILCVCVRALSMMDW